MYYIYKIQIGERLGLTASSHGRSVKPISLRSYNKANLYPYSTHGVELNRDKFTFPVDNAVSCFAFEETYKVFKNEM